MKRTKRTLSIFLTLALVLGMLPAVALADAADITGIKVRGAVDVALSNAGADVASARAKTVEVALTAAQLADTATAAAVVTETGTADAVVAIVAGGDDSSIKVVGDISATAELKVALVPGDVIWIADGTQIFRILINQKADGVIDGESTVKNAIINVVLPLDIDFAINPLQIGDVTTGSQVTTVDYRIVNKSNAPVLVNFDLEATLGTGVNFVDNKSSLTPDLLVGATKDAYFAVLGASAVAVAENDGLTFADPSGGATFSYDPTLAGTLVPFDATDAEANLKILLGAATGEPVDTLATANAGVSSFQFYAELNTYAGWVANDIKIEGSYNLQGIKASDYTAPSADTEGKIYAGLNIMKSTSADPDPENDVKFAVGTTTGSLSIARSGFTSYKVFIADKPASITSVTNTATSYTLEASTHYAYDSATGVLTMKILPSSATAGFAIVAGSTTYTLTVNVTG